MIKKILVTVAMMIAEIPASNAGTIANGVWLPGNCGEEPKAPLVDESSIEAYNLSVKAINDWQQKANAYNTCLINEANADNALIAKTANEEQARFRDTIEKIKAETTDAKARLENR